MTSQVLSVVPKLIPPLVQGKPLAGWAGLFTCCIRFSQSQLPVATVRWFRPMEAAGSSTGRGTYWSPLSEAPIGLEQETAATGSCDWPNLLMQQVNKPAQPARGFPCTSGGTCLGNTGLLQKAYRIC
uniref:Uncharacterized protein n=1 Tax=Gopherus agassizii TaxID=38772 RepID=A0A452IDD5_9SAUR